MLSYFLINQCNPQYREKNHIQVKASYFGNYQFPSQNNHARVQQAPTIFENTSVIKVSLIRISFSLILFQEETAEDKYIQYRRGMTENL